MEYPARKTLALSVSPKRMSWVYESHIVTRPRRPERTLMIVSLVAFPAGLRNLMRGLDDSFPEDVDNTIAASCCWVVSL